jgi:hypothetical protein
MAHNMRTSARPGASCNAATHRGSIVTDLLLPSCSAHLNLSAYSRTFQHCRPNPVEKFNGRWSARQKATVSATISWPIRCLLAWVSASAACQVVVTLKGNLKKESRE